MNKLYSYAKSCLGKKLSPQFTYLGCVEALSNVFRGATNQELGENASTYRLYLSLQKDIRFTKMLIPLPGDIILSPTGFGNGNISNGHTGIVSENSKIMSNNSTTLKWEENYDLISWRKRYRDLGGFPVLFYRFIDLVAINDEEKKIELMREQISLLSRLIALLKKKLNII